MADSEWESISKKSKNRIIYSIGIGLPLVLLGAFFLNNNWDIINPTTPKEEKKTIEADELQQSETHSTEMIENADSSGMIQVDMDVLPPLSDKIPAAISELKKKENKEGLEAHFEKDSLSIDRTFSSLTLSSIKCHTTDRSDLLLYLSVQLLSDIPVLESRVLAMRDEFRVVIQKIVRDSELTSLNKEQLRTDIIRFVNEYIGKDIFKDLKFTEFTIEKVMKK